MSLLKSRFLGGAAALAALAGAAEAAQIISPDGVVYNSLCVGFDCPSSPSFGADTIRLQENNLRIHFDDTSAGSFPNQDWRIEVNSNASGGAEYFRVIDATANRNIFTLEANAPSNSLVVDNGGRLGLGTANPVVEIHTANGDTPTLRLEQTTASGFAAQTWDVAGNETSFFIRDATNGSTLPFRIRPGASSNALVVDSDGDVGIGVLAPSGPLHIRRSGPAFFQLEDTTGETWNIQSNGTDFRITNATTAGVELALTQAGDLTILGELTTSGSCSVGCDRVFDADYALPTIGEHSARMFDLGYLPNVGPTAEDAPFNVSDKMGRILNELEHAHIYIAELHGRLETLEAELDALK